MKERLLTIQQATAKLDDKFSLTDLTSRWNADKGNSREMRQTVGKIDDTLRLEHKESPELTDESM